jgi:hypothetical protein
MVFIADSSMPGDFLFFFRVIFLADFFALRATVNLHRVFKNWSSARYDYRMRAGKRRSPDQTVMEVRPGAGFAKSSMHGKARLSAAIGFLF